MSVETITQEQTTTNFNPSISNNKTTNMFSFRISDDFLASYKTKTPPFGYKDAGGNSVGEITFLRTYSRLKEDGTKETWVDVCERVINGMYSLQKDHCKRNRLPWNDAKAQASAKEAFDRLFNLKWTPPGRGLWVMGTQIVNVQRNSAALQNCAFVSTAEMNKLNPAKPFAFLMEASMLGVGVGFDDKGADKDFTIYEPSKPVVTEAIEDSREGWVQSVTNLINCYLKADQNPIEFDYSLVRPAGTPIKTFGGTASGPGPLIKLHKAINSLFKGRDGQKLTRKDIADIGNLIGVCVVSGIKEEKRAALKSAIKAYAREIMMNEENVTGSGATFTPGSGENYATPYAFGKKKGENRAVKFLKKIGWKVADLTLPKHSKMFDYKKIYEMKLNDMFILEGY